MPSTAVYGNEILREQLAGSIASGRFPQAALLVGPAGVGKQRLALWVAQVLLCESESLPPGEPCGECSACRQTSRLTHPDLHWFVPIPRPKAADPAKQLAEAKDLLGEAVAERRENPHYDPPSGMVSHPLASIRALLEVVYLKPFRGARKVIILGDAERLVVQEASQEAANALLKVLEEPPADTYIMVTASHPHSLLSTIRSRLVPIRVRRVPDEIVREFGKKELKLNNDKELDLLCHRAAGCIGRAIWYDSSGTEARDWAGGFVDRLAKRNGAWTTEVLSQAPWQARGDFTARLDALLVDLRGRLRGALGRDDGGQARSWLEAIRMVEAKRAEAQGNINPQLSLAVLARELERAL